MRNVLLRYRLPVSFLAAGLLIGMAVQLYKFDARIVVLAIIQAWICGATMLWNDLFDRNEDRGKSREMTDIEHAKLYRLAVIQWSVLVVIAVGWWFLHRSDNQGLAIWQSYILLSQIGVGVWLYNWIRPWYPANNVLVATTASSPVLMLFPVADSSKPLVLGVFLSVVMALVIRETLKDTEDMEADRNGNKRTLPLLFGESQAFRVVCWIACLIPWPTVIGLWLSARWHETYMLLPMFLFFGWGMTRGVAHGAARFWNSNTDYEHRMSKNMFDIWLLIAVMTWWFHPHPWLNTTFGGVAFFIATGMLAFWLLQKTGALYKRW
jgi:4-hydroxybenzoate polyprenyltransferase